MNKFLTIANFLAFLGVVTVNALANILPINGLNTGQVSARYNNLFVPAGFTFSIWALIYLLLLGFSIFQFTQINSTLGTELNRKIGLKYIFASIANMVWILAWHNLKIDATLVIMFFLFACLLFIYNMLHIGPGKEPLKVKIFVWIPFSVYLGWISVATIANFSAFLVQHSWEGFGLAPHFWAALLIIIATVIAAFMLLRLNDIFYALVVIWALFGIAINRLSEQADESILVGEFARFGLLVLVVLLMLRLFKKKHYLVKSL